MPLFKKFKAANLGSTSSEVTLVDPATYQSTTQKSALAKSKQPKQALLSSEKDKWNTLEARLAYIINK